MQNQHVYPTQGNWESLFKTFYGLAELSAPRAFKSGEIYKYIKNIYETATEVIWEKDSICMGIRQRPIWETRQKILRLLDYPGGSTALDWAPCD